MDQTAIRKLVTLVDHGMAIAVTEGVNGQEWWSIDPALAGPKAEGVSSRRVSEGANDK